jgi:hypothetical protein
LKEIRTQIQIDASAQKSWQVLTNFAKFPEWNPIIKQIRGKAEVGSRLEIHLHTNKGKTRVYRPIVNKVESNRELRWTGKSFVPGFFNGERIFTIQSISGDSVRFLHSELFSGFGAFIAGNLVKSDILESFNKMNIAFKKRVEQDN